MYSLPAASPSAAGKVRSFLAGQQQNDVDLLRSLRGHSLDTLQRQLVGLAVSQVSFCSFWATFFFTGPHADASAIPIHSIISKSKLHS